MVLKAFIFIVWPNLAGKPTCATEFSWPQINTFSNIISSININFKFNGHARRGIASGLPVLITIRNTRGNSDCFPSTRGFSCRLPEETVNVHIKLLCTPCLA